MKIYIVHEYGGEYEDKWDTILGAFTTLEKAQELRDRKKKENDEYSKKCRTCMQDTRWRDNA